MKKAPLGALLAALLLVASACGSDKEAAQVSTNVAAGIARPDGGLLDQAEATCVAKKLVAEIGVAGLRTAGTITATGTYTANGANVNPTTSAAYTKALLACVGQQKAVASIRKTLSSPSLSKAMSAEELDCYANKVVTTIDVAHLMSSKYVTDAGENGPSPQPDEKTATSLTDALLGCVDYFALQTVGVEEQKLKGFEPAVYQRCLKRTIPAKQIRSFLIALQARTADAQSLSTTVGSKSAACQKAAVPAATKK